MYDIIVCPYCHRSLKAEYCELCGIQYRFENNIYHLYDGEKEHWVKCLKQLDALKKLDPGHENDSSHDNPEYPYNGSDLSSKANAGMFNVAKELIQTNNVEIGLDCGCYHGWASMQMSKYCPIVALDITDHKYYGLGSIPNMNRGIFKIVADGCYLPFCDNSFDFVIMVSSWHHLHDRLRGLNECYRILKNAGIMVLLGEHYMPDNDIGRIMNDGIRDYEGLPYTREDLEKMLLASRFSKIKHLPIRYTDNMDKLAYDELVGLPASNSIIYGKK